jgi:hypothetical protein
MLGLMPNVHPTPVTRSDEWSNNGTTDAVGFTMVYMRRRCGGGLSVELDASVSVRLGGGNSQLLEGGVT